MSTERCQNCEKPLFLCVCDGINPGDNRIFVLILRHPQEQDTKLGTAKITTLQLKNSALKTGLSWPNLTKALGRAVDPKKWGVLYLGTARTEKTLPDRILTVLSRKDNPLPDSDEILAQMEGIILLDGTWAQAKSLWWRNAWMLKCRRLVLRPPEESLYGHLRKEPRRESVSTIEAAAYTLAALENDESMAAGILSPFRLLLKKAQGGKP